MRKSLYLSLATGVVLGLAYPGTITTNAFSGYLILVGLLPLLHVVLSDSNQYSKKHVFAILYTAFFVYHGIANWWVASFQEQTDPYLLVSGLALWVGHPLFLMLPWLALIYVRRRLSIFASLGAFPLLFTGFEYCHGQSDASYPWLTIGYALIDTPLSQAADIVGVYGLSFFIASITATIYAAYLFSTKRLILLSAAAAFVLLWLGYGVITQHHYGALEGKNPLNVALVQTNENPWDKWSDPREQVRTHKLLTQQTFGASTSKKADLVVWPETAIPYAIRLPQHSADWAALMGWLNDADFALLTGFPDYMAYPIGEAPPSSRQSEADPAIRYDAFNAAAILTPNGISIHRKTCLTPFAERLPFADQLTFAMSWIEWGVGISAWGKGALREPLALKQDGENLANIGVIICIESIYPEMVSDLVNNGATVLCVITNDAWYNGTPGPRQHYDIARMRAIEQRRWLFRCALSGVTGIVAPTGASVAELPEMTQGVLRGVVYQRSDTTLYSSLGDAIPLCSVILASGLMFIAGYRGHRKSTSSAHNSTTVG